MQSEKPNAVDELHAFSTAAHYRWKELMFGESEGSPVRFPHGYYEMAFSLVGAQTCG